MDGGLFRCCDPSCGRLFVTAEFLSQHVSKEGHTRNESRASAFPRRTRYSFHRHRSSKQSAFQCMYCWVSFPSASHLQRHTETEHIYTKQSGKTKQCEQCQKWFASSYTLTRHMQIHTGVKFECGICNKVFTQKYAWIVHMKKLHNKDEELQYGMEAYA